MDHDQAAQMIAVAKSLDAWMFWVCFWIFVSSIIKS